jgi:hypothetical protein
MLTTLGRATAWYETLVVTFNVRHLRPMCGYKPKLVVTRSISVAYTRMAPVQVELIFCGNSSLLWCPQIALWYHKTPCATDDRNQAAKSSLLRVLGNTATDNTSLWCEGTAERRENRSLSSTNHDYCHSIATDMPSYWNTFSSLNNQYKYTFFILKSFLIFTNKS